MVGLESGQFGGVRLDVHDGFLTPMRQREGETVQPLLEQNAGDTDERCSPLSCSARFGVAIVAVNYATLLGRPLAGTNAQVADGGSGIREIGP